MGLPTTWVCRDGRRLLIAEMEESHIVNCIAMMRRNGFLPTSEFLNFILSAPSGDHARDAWEQEMLNTWPSASLEALEAELERRRLKEPA